MVGVVEKAAGTSNLVDVGVADALGSQSPAQIDGQLAELDYSRFVLVTRQDQYFKAAGEFATGKRNFNRCPDMAMAAKMEGMAEGLAPKIADLDAQIAPLNAEFVRRGGWTRAFLVNNSNGHVHSSRGCSTCFVTTEFAWLTEYSGGTEAAIVADAGQRACTVCYPSAPAEVLNRPTRIFTKDEKAAAAARAEKAAAKAAKDALQVLDPATGKVLFKTERAALNEVSRLLDSGLLYTDAQCIAGAREIVVALAAKQFIDAEKLFDAAHANAVAKFRKMAIQQARKSLAGISAVGAQREVVKNPENWHASIRQVAQEEGLI